MEVLFVQLLLLVGFSHRYNFFSFSLFLLGVRKGQLLVQRVPVAHRVVPCAMGTVKVATAAEEGGAIRGTNVTTSSAQQGVTSPRPRWTSGMKSFVPSRPN